MLVSEAKLQAWAPQMLSVLRIVAALLFLQVRPFEVFRVSRQAAREF